MIVKIVSDLDTIEMEVESYFEPGKITYIEPESLANVTLYYRLNEVMIQKTGTIQFQEYFVKNQVTSGFYKRDGMMFKTIIETNRLVVTPDLIRIDYNHNIEGHITNRRLEFSLFK